MLRSVLPVIRWTTSQDQLLDQAENQFIHLLAGSLGCALARLEQTEPVLVAEVLARAGDASSLRRVLLAPETSCRLLWPGLDGGNERELGIYLADALGLELARRSGKVPARSASTNEDRLRWSALGDSCFDVDRGVWIEQLPVAGLALDVRSPAATRYGRDLRIGCGLHAYDDLADEASALRKLEKAMESLHFACETIARFVRRFTIVANIVVDSEMNRFSSGSTNQYVGRSIFWNAHLPSVDVGTLAEALVHEAVHSLLYMHEACSPWFPVKSCPPDEHDRIVSPWSGATLGVESFLQACFVWYALLHFWRAAHRASAFTPERIEMGLTTARAGFLKGSLTERVTRERLCIAPEVLHLISAMQRDVTCKWRTQEHRGAEAAEITR